MVPTAFARICEPPELATLRRLLRLAQEWKVLARVPRIRLLRGERNASLC